MHHDFHPFHFLSLFQENRFLYQEAMLPPLPPGPQPLEKKTKDPETRDVQEMKERVRKREEEADRKGEESILAKNSDDISRMPSSPIDTRAHDKERFQESLMAGRKRKEKKSLITMLLPQSWLKKWRGSV